MILYKANSNTLSLIQEKPFKLEREIQTLFEQNLSHITGLEFVASEFQIESENGKRIDTLAFDPESRAFVIIEYKRDRKSSVVDQGLTYLNLMLRYRANFVLKYNETFDERFSVKSVDWSQSRVVFVAPDFTDYQKQATDFKNLAIELWTVKRFANDTIAIEPICKSGGAPMFSLSGGGNKEQAADSGGRGQKGKGRILKESDQQEVIQKIRPYIEDDLLSNKPDEVRELYESYRDAILSLESGIEIKPGKLYVSFKINKALFCGVEIQNKQLKLCINLKQGELSDSSGLCKDVSKVGHWCPGDYQVLISDDEPLEYIMSLIKQAIKIKAERASR